MNKIELLNKAIYILFPKKDNIYLQYNNILNIHKIPYVENSTYVHSRGNSHHYTTSYSYNVVMPFLSKLLKFNYDINDFNKIYNFEKNELYINDFSYLYPKQDADFTVEGFERNLILKGNYNILVNNEENYIRKYNYSYYHKLYIFSHLCSHIHNNSILNNRKLLISCDSQMIPTIPLLSLYFSDIYVFDNRTDNMPIDNRSYEQTISFAHKYQDINFSDVLISLWTKKLTQYIDINLK